MESLRRAIGAVLLTAIFVSGLLVVAPAFANEWRPPVQLTTNAGYDVHPDWSPDGSRIAFSSEISGITNIWLMDPDGGSKVQLTGSSQRDTRPCWHPGGDTIVFNRPERENIWAIDVSLGEPSTFEIYSDGCEDQAPRYSPDGEKIAFEKNPDETWEIFTINSDGSGLFQVTDLPGTWQQKADWHPDGTRIAFARWSHAGEHGIWTIHPDGENLTKVCDKGRQTPRWSRNGTKIAFESSEISGNLDIYIINGDGTNLVQVTTNPADDRFPTWSPDGQSISFMSTRSGNWDIWVTTRATETARPLKEKAIDELQDVKPTGDKKLDKKIDKVIRHIEKSLKDKLWIDKNHLDPKRGKKVFYEEKKAAKDLMKLTRKHDLPEEIKVVLSAVTLKLVDADSLLARTAIDDAMAVGGKEKEIEKAEKEMAKAEKDKSKAKYDKAIDHYRHAWEHAQKAMKRHKKPKHEQIGINDRGVPRAFSLSQNHPNPATNSTTIQYALPEDSHVKLEVYNTAGQKVMVLVDERQEAGHRSADLTTERLSAGIYFYRIKAGDHQSTRKMIILN